MKNYDVVVIGGGLAGFCAAIASAREGAKTVLIQDRPVLGGNSSSEIRVPLGGACDFNPWARESGLLEEAFLEERKNVKRRVWMGETTSYWDFVLYSMCREEQNLDLMLNVRAGGVTTENNRIVAIQCSAIDKEEDFSVAGTVFIDATGDGVVAFRSGVETRFGRESKAEFNEDLAPDVADDSVMGSTLSFHAEDAGEAVPFKAPTWAQVFQEDSALLHRTHTDVKSGYWWIEVGKPPYHTIHENDAIRDELYRQLLGVWDHIKNHGEHGAENLVLDFIGAVPGKRESRRIVGPYIMREQDLRKDQLFFDSVAYGGWFCDLHTVGGILNNDEPPEASFDGNLQEEDSRQMNIYSIPLRSLFAKDMDNLFMAGRDISVSHVALGSTRLMATCAVIGQAAGTAAAYSIVKQRLPKDFESADIHWIQQQLLRKDCYIPTLVNNDPKDLARGAQVRVSSHAPLHFPEQVKRGYEYESPRQKTFCRSNLDVKRAQLFPCTVDFLEKVKVFIESDRSQATVLDVSLIASHSINDFDSNIPLLKKTVPVDPFSSGWIEIDLSCKVEPGSLLWLQIASEEQVYWLYSDDPPTGTVSASRIIKNHRPQKGSYALKIYPDMYPYQGENLLSGQTRPEKWTNIWISDPKQPLPAWVEYTLAEKAPLNTIQLVFDTNLNIAHSMVPGLFRAKECVKAYTLYYRDGNDWKELLQEADNWQRQRIHRFPLVETDGLRLEIRETNGDASARLYELRAYHE